MKRCWLFDELNSTSEINIRAAVVPAWHGSCTMFETGLPDSKV